MEIIIPLLFFIILAVLAIWLLKRIRTVEEGHVVVTQWMDRYSRVVKPGPYILWPFEEEVAKIMVRQREATILVPNVFTHGGLPVTVNLRYTYRLDPARMVVSDELYYSDADRREQQVTIFKQLFQEIIEDLNPSNNKTESENNSASEKTPLRADIPTLFSPFGGEKGIELRKRLVERAREMLAEHGIVLASAPLVVGGLQLPQPIVDAYMTYITSDLDSTSRSTFIERVRKAAPTMSDTGLVQLLYLIQNPSAELHAIFSSGTVQPDVYLHRGDTTIRQPAPPPSPLPLPQPQPPSGNSSAPTPTQPTPPETYLQDLPLTREVMDTLKFE
jgi:hypothetical protein